MTLVRADLAKSIKNVVVKNKKQKKSLWDFFSIFYFIITKKQNIFMVK